VEPKKSGETLFRVTLRQLAPRVWWADYYIILGARPRRSAADDCLYSQWLCTWLY